MRWSLIPKKHKQQRSPLAKLSQALQFFLFNVNLLDMVSAAMSCQMLYDVLREPLKRRLDKRSRWQGDRIVVLGSSTRIDDLSPELRQYLAAPGILCVPSDSLVSTITMISPQDHRDANKDFHTRTERSLHRMTRLFSRKQTVELDNAFTVHGMVLQYLVSKQVQESCVPGRTPLYHGAWFNCAYSHLLWPYPSMWEDVVTSTPARGLPDEHTVLRNLEAKQYIRGEDFVRHIVACARPSTYLDFTRLGDVALLSTMYSSIPIRERLFLPVGNELRDVRHGPWAGHRFDLCAEKDLGRGEWEDVSEEVLRDLAHLQSANLANCELLEDEDEEEYDESTDDSADDDEDDDGDETETEAGPAQYIQSVHRLPSGWTLSAVPPLSSERTTSIASV